MHMFKFVFIVCYIYVIVVNGTSFRPFASPCMVEQTASFLNCFLLHLVGPKRKLLKVRVFYFVSFAINSPRTYVTMRDLILRMGLNNESAFVANKNNAFIYF